MCGMLSVVNTNQTAISKNVDGMLLEDDISSRREVDVDVVVKVEDLIKEWENLSGLSLNNQSINLESSWSDEDSWYIKY